MLFGSVHLQWINFPLSFLAISELFILTSSTRTNNLPALQSVPDEYFDLSPLHLLVRQYATITCSGSTTAPGVQRPIRLSNICPMAEIGGDERGNLGAFCWWNLARPVIFFTARNAPALVEGARLRLLCMSSCYCNVDPLGSSYRALFWRNLEPNRLVIDLNLVTNEKHVRLTPYSGLLAVNSGMQTSAARLGLQVPVYDDDPNQLMASSLSEYFIAPYAGRRPFCAGPLPTWDLPLPYSHLHYPDLQALCAVAPLGGSPHGSAGFTCVRRPNSLAEEPFELVYFDEWTPHALTNSNWPTGLAVRLYCAAYCACNERQLADRSRQALQNVRVSWLAGGVWVTLLDGGVQLILPGGAVVAIVGEGAVAGPPPPGLIAMRPWWLKNQASVEEIRESQSIDSGVCGSSCRSNQDCGSGATACSRCMVSINKQQPDGSRMRGMDIFLGAACTIVGLGLREKRLGSGGTRGKRDLRKTDEVCACNATYVSRACCDSADGMLWEDTRLKLGALTVAETSEVRDDEDAFDLVQ